SLVAKALDATKCTLEIGQGLRDHIPVDSELTGECRGRQGVVGVVETRNADTYRVRSISIREGRSQVHIAIEHDIACVHIEYRAFVSATGAIPFAQMREVKRAIAKIGSTHAADGSVCGVLQ